MSDEERQAAVDDLEKRYSDLRRESLAIRREQAAIEAILYAMPAKYDTLLELEAVVAEFMAEEWWATIGQIEQRPSGRSLAVFTVKFQALLDRLDQLRGVTHAQLQQQESS
jgi:hypothetical protein